MTRYGDVVVLNKDDIDIFSDYTFSESTKDLDLRCFINIEIEELLKAELVIYFDGTNLKILNDKLNNFAGCPCFSMI